MPDVFMPRLSDSMEAGTILKWLAAPGAEVAPGQALVEIETDKAAVTYDAEAAGILEIVAAVGDSLPIGALIARLVPVGDQTPRIGDFDSPTLVEGPAESGTPAPPSPTSAPITAPAETAKGPVTRQEPTRAQQAVARRVAESKATIPHLVLTTDIDMGRALDLRAQLEHTTPPGPTTTDIVVKACALALRECPRANGAYRDGRFELYGRVNVGVTMAAADAVVAPTIFDADQRPLAEIATATRTLAERARTEQLTPPELSGATFTVSDLGTHGATSGTAIVHPSQAAALAVGTIAPRAVVHDGEVVARPTMSATLACDHRVLYGAEAAAFLARIRELLESPVALVS